MSEAVSPAACQISSTRTALCLKLVGTFAGCACKENISQKLFQVYISEASNQGKRTEVTWMLRT